MPIFFCTEEIFQLVISVPSHAFPASAKDAVALSRVHEGRTDAAMGTVPSVEPASLQSWKHGAPGLAEFSHRYRP